MTGNVFTLPGANFTTEHNGLTFEVPGALGANADPLIGIGTRISATQMQLSVTATTAVTSVAGYWGPNNSSAIVEALANCRRRNIGALFIPSGYWGVGGVTLDMFDNLTVYGMGRSSVMVALNYVDSGFYANGKSRVTLRDLSFLSRAKVRGERSTTGALWFLGCTDITVERLYIDGGKAAGMYIDGCTRGDVRNIEVRNTKADGVHIVGGSNQIGVSGIRGYDTGDDTVGVISYLSQPQTHSINVSDVISVNSRARAVAIGGSRNVLVSNCQAFSPGAHGYLVAWEEGFVPAAETHIPSKITFDNCRIEDADGSIGPPEGFQAFLVIGDATHKVEDVKITNCVVVDSNQSKIAHAKHVRFLNNEVRDSRYSGLVVEDCEDVDVCGNKFNTVEGPGISFTRVNIGQIDNNFLIECQTFDEFGTGGSTGRIHVVESTDVFGGGNRDKRTSTTPSLGPILTSSNTRVIIGVTEIDAAAVDTTKRVVGMEVQSLRDAGAYRDQLLLGTNRQVNVTRYAITADRGLFAESGDIHADAPDGKFLGSGGAAALSLGSGYPRLDGEGGMDLEFDRSGANPGASLRILRDGAPLLSITSDGTIFAAGRLYLGNLGTSFIVHGDGAPAIAAQPGAIYIDRVAPLDQMILLGSPGPSPVWVPVPISPELPGGGAVGNVLRIASATPSRVLQFGSIDLGVASSVQLAGATDRPVKRAANGALWVDRVRLGDANEVNCPGGLGDVLANDGSGAVSFFTQTAVAAFVASLINYYATIEDLQDQIDNLVATKADAAHTHSGTTGSGGSPAHTHSFST